MLKKFYVFGIATALVASCIFSFCNEPTSPARYALTVACSPSGAGTVALSPASGTFAAGTVVTLTATPAAGFDFVNWTGDATGTSASISVTMDSAKSVTANFSPLYVLSISDSSPVAGSVTLNPAGGTYVAGTVVTLIAAPAEDFDFVNWTGDASGATASVQVTMDAAKTVAAHFAPKAGFIYKIRSKPLAGFEGTVDAVTKASDVLDTLLIRIDFLPPSDTLKELNVYWGDSTAPKVVAGARFPLGQDYAVLTHWYTRNADTVTGLCSTIATATTVGGIMRDTTIRIKVMKKGEY